MVIAMKNSEARIRQHGGYVKDLPINIKRVFDDRRKKRKVYASVLMYSVGRHYYATLAEESNPALVLENNKWIERICWDDGPKIKGRTESKRCNNWHAARAWIDQAFNRIFGKKTHRLVMSPSTCKNYWKNDGE